MRKVKNEADHASISMNHKATVTFQKFVTTGAVISLLVSVGTWITYLFFYNPYTGALPLLACVPSGIIGVIFSVFLPNKVWQWGMVVLNILIAGSLPLVFYVGFLTGF